MASANVYRSPRNPALKAAYDKAKQAYTAASTGLSQNSSVKYLAQAVLYLILYVNNRDDMVGGQDPIEYPPEESDKL